MYISVDCLLFIPSCRVNKIHKTGRKMVARSVTGGMKETQEMVDFAAKQNITVDIEIILMEYVNTTIKRLAKGNVKYQFVIDIGNTLAATNSED